MQCRMCILFLVIFFLASFLYAQHAQEAEDIDVYKYAGQLLPENLLKKTDITFEDVSLEMALNTIQDEYGIDLSYNNSRIPAGKRINLQMKNVFVLEALLGVLKNAGMTLQVTQGGNLALVEGKVPSIGKSKKVGAGKIVGVVTDKTSGEPLPGANIFLDGTSIGAASQVDGKYFISNVPPGSYTLVVKYIGYKDVEIAINVLPKGTVTVNAELEYAGLVAGEEVTITAQAEGQIAAINQQLSASTIKNVVSADRIQEIPDVNAAESVGRLPGISIIRSGGEGQKVSIRGMSPKYNIMMVNGVRLQSTDRDDRSVDLNMISSNMLSGIEVTKALTADMDADAVGGTVNLKLAGAEPGWHGDFMLQGGYGSMQNNYDNYKFRGSVSNRFINNGLGVNLSANIESVDRSSDMLRAGYSINEESDKNEQGLSNIDLDKITLRDVAAKRKRQGVGLMLDYRLPSGKLSYHSFVSQLSENQNDIANYIEIDLEQFSGGIIEREFENTVMSQALQGEYRIFQMEMDFSISQSVSKQHRPGDLQLDVNTAVGSSISSVLSIEEAFNSTPNEYLRSITVNNTILGVDNMFNMKRDVTEEEKIAQGNLSIPYQFGKTLAGKFRMGFKYGTTKRDNKETHHVVSFEADVKGQQFIRTLPDIFPHLGVEPTDYERYLRASLFEDVHYDEGNFLSGKEAVNSLYWKGSFQKLEELNQHAENQGVYVVDGLASTSRSFEMSETLAAFYLTAEMNIGRWITFLPGVRYESFNTDYLAYKGIQTGWRVWNYYSEPVTSTRKSENWFPQIHLRVKPVEWFDIRLASTRSLIRPDYRAYSPYSYYAGVSAQPLLQIGNTLIKSSISNNLDVYASVYSNKIGLLTMGGFYKEIDNIITPLRFHTSDNSEIDDRYELGGIMTTIDTWINVNDSPTIVRGFELDWQTNFWYLPTQFKGLVLNVNYTRLYSETVYPYDVFYKDPNNIFAPGVFVDSSRTARMPHQPNDVLNLTLGYDLGGFSARLSFLFQGQVLGVGGAGETAGNIRGNSRMTQNTIGIRPELDPFTDDYYRWDVSVNQTLPWPGFQLYLSANNISNSVDQQSLSVLGKLKAKEYYGRTFNLGIRYKF